ncbi:hypothetical protein BE221DRAFT_190618 [Ostreococcus tauri]|uniref:GDP-Man:Man(3)GlcNAc(2)-PP-Dol alpha-1,2-mannosyltransferase n=2 Tax=Ostreococcus tauri TaxID=70448 RepID=A0A1Y5IL29_OSTTA|nr:hypothetical protein BE221DRAFT_190618 [Ostreococcus tauri]
MSDRARALAWTLVAIVLVTMAHAWKTSARARRTNARRIIERVWNRRKMLDDARGTTAGRARGADRVGRLRVIGFYHPAHADGGGGERVLFAAIASAQRDAKRRSAEAEASGRSSESARVAFVVYASAPDMGARGDRVVDGADVVRRAKERFGVELDDDVVVVRLRNERYSRAENYRWCTIARQFLGSAFLGWEALWAFTPDVFVDTVGHAATYPLARYVFGCETAAYVHYPTVSTDMIDRVAAGRVMYNNSGRFAASKFLTGLKLVYYRLFAVAYRWCGRACACVMVNSSWTKAHIDTLWGVDAKIVYPPCNVEDLSTIPLTRPLLDANGAAVKKDKASIRVVSVGQFRPEKAHLVQIAAWKALKKMKNRSTNIENAILVFVGGCRDKADRERLADLKQSVKDLELEDSVQFHVDAPYDVVRRELSRASIGLHAMLDEHFGICVVEYMAAGAIPVAHASGGPLLDIIRDVPKGVTGFTADTPQAFAEILEHVIMMRRAEREEIAGRARERSKLFTEANFRESFINALVNAGIWM